MSVPQLPAGVPDGTVVEVVPGLFYRYDTALHTWFELNNSNLNSPLATPFRSGLMSSEDFRKLNRLVLPPLLTTITAESCNTTFSTGKLALTALDDLVTVNGTRKVAGRADLPYHIHQHTYGFDFGLDINNLLTELRRRGQLVLHGPAGKKGPKGKKGPPGVPQMLSGPKGAIGPPGSAPPCTLQLLPESYQAKAQEELKKVIVSLRVELDPDDINKYSIVAQRQEVGIPANPTGMLKVGSDSSSWVLALTSIGGAAQPVYCVDVEQIVDAIHDKFLSEVQRMKTGFEAVVQFWLQQMSDLFDKQKLALCCALEFCQSRNSNTLSRRHIEDARAASVGSGKVSIHDRTSSDALDQPIAVDCDPESFPGGTTSTPPPVPPPVGPPSPPPARPIPLPIPPPQQLMSTVVPDSIEAGLVQQEQPLYLEHGGDPQQSAPVPQELADCTLQVEQLSWYQAGWRSGDCCGAVIRLFGQDYIVTRRSVDNETGCGEARPSCPCDHRYGSPAYAWPTFDGVNFVGLPLSGTVSFRYSEQLQTEVEQALRQGSGLRGDVSALRTVLFPVIG